MSCLAYMDHDSTIHSWYIKNVKDNQPSNITLLWLLSMVSLVQSMNSNQVLNFTIGISIYFIDNICNKQLVAKIMQTQA